MFRQQQLAAKTTAFYFHRTHVNLLSQTSAQAESFPSPPRKWDFLSVQKQKSPCKSIDLQGAISVSLYPERGSNPHAFQHRCLRPTCLPIPTSGRKAVAKVIVFFGFCKLISKNFADRYKISNFALIIRKVFKVFRF